MAASSTARVVWVLCAVAACGSADGAGGRGAVARGAGRPASDSARTADDPLVRRADRARVRGDSAAKVWMVEVSDFQCPYCKGWHDETYPVVLRDYVATGRVKMAYVNFPLPMHQQAWPAAEAAMCAGAQGKFWEMHDALFAAQAAWSARPAVFDSLAGAVGVDVAAWRQCVGSKAMRRLIQSDYDRSQRAGVNSTPTFIIGDQTIEGAQPADVFRRALDSALARAGGGH
jgi:protein-disulfide isomerase